MSPCLRSLLAALAFAAAACGQYTRPNVATECVSSSGAGGGSAAGGLSVDDATTPPVVGDLSSAGQCTAGQDCQFQIVTAQDFTIEYYPSFKVVTNLRAAEVPVRHVLHPCGTQPPAPAALEFLRADGANVTTYAVPLTAVAVDDTTAAWALEALGLSDRVRYSTPFATSPCLASVAAPAAGGAGGGSGCGRAFTSESVAGPGSPPTQLADVDAVFTFAEDPEGKAIAFTAAADPAPLNRAEHLLYISAFFNAEAAAAELFQSIAAAYAAASVPPGDAAAAARPTVLWLSYLDDASFYAAPGPGDSETDISGSPGWQASFDPYKSQITAAAGGANPSQAAWAEAETTGAVSVTSSADDITFIAALWPGGRAGALAAIAPLLRQADIVIDETYLLDVSTASEEAFMQTWGITEATRAQFPFLVSGRLWRNDKATTPGGVSDWFGRGVIRPDAVISDLRGVITGGADAEADGLYFFRNVARGDAVAGVSGVCRGGFTCDAWAEQQALVPAGATDEDSSGSPDTADEEAPTEESSGGPGAISAAAAAISGVLVATLVI